jgi:bifunctional UDP-N-acetylglucosamine pyrophosphorylase/glucosamine-1-phosphate N-acetyltransferase
MTQRAAIILAAGQGTRMKSTLPKVMHGVGGRPMVDWSIALAKQVGCERIIIVAHPTQQVLIDHVSEVLGAEALAYQDPPQGTGHAVQCAQAALEGFEGDVVVLYGDSPMIPVSAIEDLFEVLAGGTAIGVLGFEAAVPGAYGRLIKTSDGNLDAIVEAKEASPEQLAVTLCNSGVMAGRHSDMFRLLDNVTNDNAKGEYYLTDLVGLARGEGGVCKVVECAEADLIGCDSRADLAEAEAIFQARRRSEALENGVTLVAPDTVYFSFDTALEPDVFIEPNVVFGTGVTVAGGTRIKAFSHLEGAKIAADCVIGPYARLRPGTVLEAGVKIGNFVETKNTRMAQGAKANHLSYLGDGVIGANANIGAGTIFCNYDGYMKYETKVGVDAFVGSNSALVAPVTIGDRAMVGSGSVITRDVDPDALAVGRGKQAQMPGWATRFRDKKSAEKAKKTTKTDET